MDATQFLKAFEVLALLLAGAVFVVWQLRSTERDLQRSRAQRLAREGRKAEESGDAIDASASAAPQASRDGEDIGQVTRPPASSPAPSPIDANRAGERPSEPRP